MFWNNIGRYDDISPDPSDEEPYPWTSFEASREFRKPAFSSEKKEYAVSENTVTPDEVISILDSVLYKNIEEEAPVKKRKGLFLHILPLGNNSDD